MNPLHLIALLVAPLSVFAVATETVKPVEAAAKEVPKVVTETPERMALIKDCQNLFLLPKDVDATERFSPLEDEELKTLRTNLLSDLFDGCVKDKFPALALDFERFENVQKSMREEAIKAIHKFYRFSQNTDDKNGAILKELNENKLIAALSPLRLFALIKLNLDAVALNQYNDKKKVAFLSKLLTKSVAELLKEKLITIEDFHYQMSPGTTTYLEREARAKQPKFTRKSLLSVNSQSSNDSLFKDVSGSTWAFIGVGVVLVAALVVVVVRSVGFESDETEL